MVTHRQLLRDVWGAEFTEHTHYLRLYMGQLRAKLEDDRPSRACCSPNPASATGRPGRARPGRLCLPDAARRTLASGSTRRPRHVRRHPLRPITARTPAPPPHAGAIGVVYGDIGTSPLYTVKEIFAPATGVR